MNHFLVGGTRTKPDIYTYYIQKKALRGQNRKNSVSLFVVYMIFCQNIFHELVFHLFTSVELFFRGFPTTRTTLTKRTQEAQATKQVRSTFISEVQLETPHQVIVDPWAASGVSVERYSESMLGEMQIRGQFVRYLKCKTTKQNVLKEMTIPRSWFQLSFYFYPYVIANG